MFECLSPTLTHKCSCLSTFQFSCTAGVPCRAPPNSVIDRKPLISVFVCEHARAHTHTPGYQDRRVMGQTAGRFWSARASCPSFPCQCCLWCKLRGPRTARRKRHTPRNSEKEGTHTRSMGARIVVILVVGTHGRHSFHPKTRDTRKLVWDTGK
jgi:hypothetical protein